MNLFDRVRIAMAMAITPSFTQKASLLGNIISYFTLGQPVWSPRDYANLTKVGFQLNVIGFKAVTLISRSFSGIPIGLYEPDGDEVEEHEVLNLLNKPNPFQSGKRFRENLCGYYCLDGNAFIEGVDSDLDNGDAVDAGPNMGTPIQLFTHRPDRMQILPSEFGTPMGYEYRANGRKRTWHVDPHDGSGPLLHVKTFHPLNDWYGMSPMEAAGWSIDQHNESSAWNKSLLQNGARPSGAMVYKPAGVIGATLTKEQYEQFKQQLDEKMSGGNNAGLPLILDGGMEWQEMGLSPKDMDWLEGRNNAAREIAMAFGVPAQMLGIPGDNTYSNMEEARASFYEETVIPLGETLIESMGNWLLPAFGLEGYQFKLELDDISALFPRRSAKWVMLKDAPLTTNEKRREMGYDKLDSPLADELLIPTGLTPLDDLGATEEQVMPDGTVVPAETSFGEDREGEEGDEEIEGDDKKIPPKDDEEVEPPKSKKKPKPPFKKSRLQKSVARMDSAYSIPRRPR